MRELVLKHKLETGGGKYPTLIFDFHTHICLYADANCIHSNKPTHMYKHTFVTCIYTNSVPNTLLIMKTCFKEKLICEVNPCLSYFPV